MKMPIDVSRSQVLKGAHGAVGVVRHQDIDVSEGLHSSSHETLWAINFREVYLEMLHTLPI
jgi:hypothetical protein